ncbi:MAG: hypothetical protein ACYCY9_03625 [Thiobacillus sp.]
MMEIRIPENQWWQFCDSFSREHYGWPVGMLKLGSGTPPDAPDRLFTGFRPLQEVREGTRGDVVEVMVTVGEGVDETSYLIGDAVALYSRMSGDVQQGLRVESSSGTSTLIEFGASTDVDSVDERVVLER